MVTSRHLIDVVNARASVGAGGGIGAESVEDAANAPPSQPRLVLLVVILLPRRGGAAGRRQPRYRCIGSAATHERGA